MRSPQPKRIGTTELWSARLYLGSSRSVDALQDSVTEYVTESGISVVGYYADNPASLTLLRWPELRKGYRTPTIPECDIALQGLAVKLQARRTKQGVIPPGMLHTMMGRKRDGYGMGKIAPLHELERPELAHFGVTDGHMISARTVKGDDVEPYGEPVGILVLDPEHEAVIHQIGHTLEQWHYAIERGPSPGARGRTDFYETPWAANS